MFLVALFCALVFHVGSASLSDGDDGVDRMDGDIAGMPITLQANDKPSVCSKMCDSNPQCVCWAYCKANCSGDPSAPLCYLKDKLMPQSLNPCRVSGVKNATLLPYAFKPLPTGAVKPQGWLKEQLQIQADGLSGHLALFWIDVANSSWIGGKGDTGLHERTPYWLNGFVPLSYQLDEPSLQAQVHKYVDYILEHQSSDGWLGPEDDKDGNMYWSKFPMMLALLQYHEVNSSDTRILPAVMKFLHTARQKMFTVPLSGWSQYRWEDMVLSVHWLLENGNTGEEQFLWDLAEQAKQQGFDWKGYYEGNDFPTGSASSLSMANHGVNVGQSLKSGAVWYRQSKDDADRNSSYQRVERLFKYHGLASGTFGADEHLAGNMPSRGTELCTVVEGMFSFETLFAVIGDPMFAEQAEKMCYNALPATLTPDMWAHQYLQEVNEANAVHIDHHVWASDGPDSILYGLEPNYGCCTGNFNQGWPKFVSHIFLQSPDGGLILSMIAPCVVTAMTSDGSKQMVSVDTMYPWDGGVSITAQSSSPFPLYVRIPSWATGTSATINGGKPQMVEAGQLFKVQCSGTTKVMLNINMTLRVERRFNQAASIYKGPLLYGLEIGENYTALRSYDFNSKDYQITNTTPWNYALQLDDDKHPEMNLEFMYRGLQSDQPPFSITGSPAMIKAKGRLLPDWQLDLGSAAAPPASPVTSNQPVEDITLLPFGATELRIGEIPTLKPTGREG